MRRFAPPMPMLIFTLALATPARAEDCAPPKWFNSQVLKIGAGDFIGFGKDDRMGVAQKLARRELANQLAAKYTKELLARPDVKRSVNFKTYPTEDVKAALPAAIAYELVSAKVLKREIVCETRYVGMSLTKAAAAQDLKTKELPAHINLALANRIDELEKRRAADVDEAEKNEAAVAAQASAKEFAGPELSYQRMKKMFDSVSPTDFVQSNFRDPISTRMAKLAAAIKKARVAPPADRAAAINAADEIARDGERLLNAVRDYRAGEYISSFEQIHGFARGSDAAAQFMTGYMYLEAQGVKRSSAEAFQWFKRAAQNGHGPAKMMIGLFYFNGMGVKVNHTEAFKWFSAAQGEGWSCQAEIKSCKKAVATAESSTDTE